MPGIEDLIEDNLDGLLVNPREVKDLVVMMEYIINNEDKRHHMALLAKKKSYD